MCSKAIRIGGLAAILGNVALVAYASGAAAMPLGCIGDVECATRPMRDTGVFEVFFLLALPVGFALVGIAVPRARILPRWMSALLAIPFALVRMAVGYILLSGRDDTVRPPASAETVGWAS